VLDGQERWLLSHASRPFYYYSTPHRSTELTGADCRPNSQDSHPCLQSEGLRPSNDCRSALHTHWKVSPQLLDFFYSVALIHPKSLVFDYERKQSVTPHTDLLTSWLHCLTKCSKQPQVEIISFFIAYMKTDITT
jgi:hypothetical protein